MKVLIPIHAYAGHGRNAGAEMTMHEMAVALVDAGHDVMVLLSQTIEPNEDYILDGVLVKAYRSRKDMSQYVPLTDVVISHLGQSEQAAILAKMWRKKMIHLVHNTHDLTWNAMRTGCDLAVYNTEWVKEASPVNCRSMVLHPAVRPEAYATTRGKSVTMVNLIPSKGVELFYEMARRFPDVPFLGVKGGYGEQDIRDMPNVTIMENQSDIREAFKQTKIVLMPSAYESYGRVAAEAQASGIPAIVSRTPGLLEAMGPNGNFADAPMTTIPGDCSKDPWSEEHFATWEAQLKKLLSPAGFSKASKNALARSAEAWKGTEAELQEFVTQTEGLIYGYRKH